MDTRVCRLCRITVDKKRSVALFSGSGLREKLAVRISQLLDIPEPTPADSFPSIICRKCNVQIPALEKAMADLDRLKTLARSSLEGRGMKRAKETSGGVEVSPDTIRQRPRSKHARKKLTFECKHTPLLSRAYHFTCIKIVLQLVQALVQRDLHQPLLYHHRFAMLF